MKYLSILLILGYFSAANAQSNDKVSGEFTSMKQCLIFISNQSGGALTFDTDNMNFVSGYIEFPKDKEKPRQTYECKIIRTVAKNYIEGWFTVNDRMIRRETDEE